MRRFFAFLAILSILLFGLLARPAAAEPPRTAEDAVPAAAPVRLIIPAIKLNQALAHVGLDKGRRPIVPKHDVGWYIHSARPAQGENVVMWGHVLRWKATPRIPAPFERLSELKIGAPISVELSNGRVRRYSVTRKVWARPSEVKYILPVGSERLTLVSCIGDNVIVKGSLTKEYRLITIATPVR